MILCGGETLLDLIARPDGAGLGFRAVPGGSPCNTARALGRLGQAVGFLAPVAADPMGDLILRSMAEDSVAALGGRSPRPCSVSLVTPVDGQPRYAIHRHATADRDIALDRLLPHLQGARALHLGSMALCAGEDAAVWEALFHAAGVRGLCRTLDVNVRPAIAAEDEAGYRARLGRMLRAADVVKLSDEDIGWLRPGAVPEAAAEALLAEAAPALVVLTRGAAGALALAASARAERPAAPVARLVDTVGAGDTFMAALLDGLARAGALRPGDPAGLGEGALAALLDRAARAAAVTCGRAGCDPPRAEELGA